MLKAYRDRDQGTWLELREGYVTYIGASPEDVKITEGTTGLRYILIANEWSFEEANATYDLWELS